MDYHLMDYLPAAVCSLLKELDFQPIRGRYAEFYSPHWSGDYYLGLKVLHKQMNGEPEVWGYRIQRLIRRDQHNGYDVALADVVPELKSFLERLDFPVQETLRRKRLLALIADD